MTIAAAPSISDGRSAGATGAVRLAILLTLGLTVVRLIVAGNVDLFFDEAYYWLWSTQLQSSYYDHPGMVALFVRAGTLIFGDTEIGVRFFGILSIAVDALLVYGVTYTLAGSARLGAWAAIFFNLTTLVTMSAIAVPDQPMLMFWLAALFGLARIAKGGSGAWWLLIGVAFGLAADSKFTTFIAALAVPIWLLVVPGLRHWLWRPSTYAGALAALAIVAPVLLWNIENDWITFTFQFYREGLGFDGVRLGGFVEYLGLIVLMATPPILLLALGGLKVVLGKGWRHDPGRALLILTPLPLLAYLTYHSFSERIGPHWLAQVVVIAVILASFGLEHPWSGAWGKAMRISRKAAIPVGLAIALIFYGALLERFLPIPRQLDTTERFRGWAEFAENAEAKRNEFGAAYILGPHYSSPAYLRFYLGRDTPAYPLGDFRRWSYLGGLMTAPPEFAAATGLYIGRTNVSVAVEEEILARSFGTLIRVDDTIRPVRNGQIIALPTWLVSDPLDRALPLFGGALGPSG